MRNLATLATKRPDTSDSVLVEADHLNVVFALGHGSWLGRHQRFLYAVNDASLTLRYGETVGLVGESGSGKTTLGRAILRRVDIKSGHIWFQGREITHVRGNERRQLTREMQMISQDPGGSLDPHMKVFDLIAEPLEVHGMGRDRTAIRARVVDLLGRVGLDDSAASQYPRAFSGGQRQRIAIARALALNPRLIVADEPVSALDVSIRAQVVNVLRDLQEELGVAYLFISHDLAVVRHISHRVLIMYAGQIVESGECEAIFEEPRHPYTRALLSAVPIPDPVLQRRRLRTVLNGEMPNPMSMPKGCRFSTRCPIARPRCSVEEPPFEEKTPNHWAACWYT